MIAEKIWLVGTGRMSRAYAQVLRNLNAEFVVIGRGNTSADRFEQELSIPVLRGGCERLLQTQAETPQAAIVAVDVESLSRVTKALLEFGARHILVEKPGAANALEASQLSKLAASVRANVLVGYNRRFYASVRRARQMIEKDGGVTSFHFEFTEWPHTIQNLQENPEAHHNRFFTNSTHIVDTAFFLGGAPAEISSFVAGGLEWHPSAAVFTGAGRTAGGALFSYHANWDAPGRWSLEFLTRKRRYVFKPIEKLLCQEVESVSINTVEDVDYSLDETFKPGIYLQTEKFLANDLDDFCTIERQAAAIEHYRLIGGYGPQIPCSSRANHD